MQLDPLGLAVVGEGVDADDRALARLDLARPGVGRSLDLGLDEAGLDRRDRAAELVDPADQLERAPLELVGQRLDEVGAAERVGSRDDTDLVREHLLSAERDRRRTLRGQRKRLVVRVRVQRLRSAEHGREGLDRDPDDVRLGLLRGQC